MSEIETTDHDKQLEDHFKRCIFDFPYYSANNLRVQTERNTLEPFVLHEVQLLLEEIWKHIEESGRLVRLYILKARRQGVSTWATGKIFHLTSCRPNKNAVLIAHEPPATEYLFGMQQRYLLHLPPEMQPQTLKNNARTLLFNNEKGTGLDSAIRCGTAGVKDFGSGQRIDYLHLCMAPDTPVLVRDGKQKFIRDLAVGDLGDSVLTHNGQWAQVTGKVKRPNPNSDGKMVVVHPWLGQPITMTPQHKVWTNLGWVEAGDLDPSWHLLSMPIRRITRVFDSLPFQGRKGKSGPRYEGPSEFPLNEETGFFVGYYLAEGHAGKSHVGNHCRIVLALHEDEEHYAIRASSAVRAFCKSPPKVRSRKGSKTKMYVLDSTPLAEFMARCFGHLDDKIVPDWVFIAGEDFCRGLVLGYLSGDSSKGTDNYIAATSIRESLTYQVRDLVASLGYGWGSVKFTPAAERYGRNCRAAWTVGFAGECGGKLRRDMGLPFEETVASSRHIRSMVGQRYRMDFDNRKVWMKIKKIEEGYCEEVYDIEVSHSDHSFRTAYFSCSNSELPKYPPENQADLLISLFQPVPQQPGTAIIIEGTAKGIGGEFYKGFWGCRYSYEIYLDDEQCPQWRMNVNEAAPKENEYCSIFIPWFAFREYRMAVDEDFVRTPEEEGWVKTFNLCNEQLMWYRWVLSNKCKGDLNKRNQEYPFTARGAFIGSGTPAFNVDRILFLKERCPEPIARYDCLISSGQWIAQPEGKLQVWEEPVPGRPYLISADVAEGLAHGDFDSADVIDHTTGMQVAHFHGKMSPFDFAKYLIHLGRRYNEAWLVPERNNHGITVVEVLEDEGYDNISFESVPDPPHKARKRSGFVTTEKSRKLILDILIELTGQENCGIQCADTLEEMLNFKIQDDGRMEADPGSHDDRVMSIAIGIYHLKILDYAVPHRRPWALHGRGKLNVFSGTRRPDPKGWT